MALHAFKFLARLATPAPVNAPIAAGDRIDAALNKLQGQINAGGSGGLPYFVAADGTVSLAEFSQTPVLMNTKLDGIIKNDGIIIEVL